MTMSRKDYKGIAKAIGKSFDHGKGFEVQLNWAKLAGNLETYLEADNERFDIDKFTNEVDHQRYLNYLSYVSL
jgi:uncharacterized protein YdgA (DUF945 family)